MTLSQRFPNFCFCTFMPLLHLFPSWGYSKYYLVNTLVPDLVWFEGICTSSLGTSALSNASPILEADILHTLARIYIILSFLWVPQTYTINKTFLSLIIIKKNYFYNKPVYQRCKLGESFLIRVSWLRRKRIALKTVNSVSYVRLDCYYFTVFWLCNFSFKK